MLNVAVLLCTYDYSRAAFVASAQFWYIKEKVLLKIKDLSPLFYGCWERREIRLKRDWTAHSQLMQCHQSSWHLASSSGCQRYLLGTSLGMVLMEWTAVVVGDVTWSFVVSYPSMFVRCTISVLRMYLSPVLDTTGVPPYLVLSPVDQHAVEAAPVPHLGCGSLPCGLFGAVLLHSSSADTAVSDGG